MISFEIFKRFFFSSRSGALIKRLSYISMTQISLSLFAFVVVISVMTGMNESITQRVNSLDPDLTLEVSQVKSIDSLKSQPVIQRLLEDQYKIDYAENSDVILRTVDGLYRGLVARGLSQTAFESMIQNMNKLDHKAKPNPLDMIETWKVDEIPGEGEAIIGYDTAQMLNIYEGDWVTLIPPEALLLPQGEIPVLERVQIKKIISTRLQQMDSQNIWYRSGLALTRFQDSPSRRVQATVKLDDAKNAASVKKSLSGFTDVKVTTWQEKNLALFAALALEKFCIGFILFLAGLISTFSVVMALSLLINQKRKDWALLKTLGFSDKSLKTLILKLGLWLSAVGVGSGVLLGLIFSLLIEYFPPSILPSIYYDSQIPSKVEPVFIIITVVVSMLVCYWACLKTVQSLKKIRLN